MKTTKKLNLNGLKVESFVTSLESKDSQTVKGGSSAPCAETALLIVVAATGAALVVSIYKKGLDAIYTGK